MGFIEGFTPIDSGIEAREHTMNDMRRLKNMLKINAIRMKSDVLTGHAPRPHTAQDIEIYKENNRHVVWKTNGMNV